MSTPDFSEKLKNEAPDPKAFEWFTQFTKKILKVSKDDAEKADNDDSRSTDTG